MQGEIGFELGLILGRPGAQFFLLFLAVKEVKFILSFGKLGLFCIFLFLVHSL